jgi:hypothetical protein
MGGCGVNLYKPGKYIHEDELNQAQKRIEQLEAELKNRDAVRLWNENEKLKEANRILCEALEFYGNDGPGFICMCEEEVGDGPMSGWVQCDSGDNARTALEQADKIINETKQGEKK